MSRRPRGLAAALLTALVMGLALPLAPPAVAAPAVPPTVGPLFLFTTALPHFCSASVIASPGGDLILTAAHCVAGTEQGIQFAPGYDRGATPYGVWTVRAAFVDPAWLRTQDPRYDYAILRVDRQSRDGRMVTVQDVVGADVLGIAPPPAALVQVDGYAFGLGDRALSCSARVRFTGDYPTLDCPSLPAGTSGAPWRLRTPLPRLTFTVGVIGGLHQGGCTDAISYSAPFTWQVYLVWLRAVLGAPSDFVPFPGPDGC